MKGIGLAVFFVLALGTTWAQKSGTVKGTVMDTITRQPIPAATITLLQKSDSSLVSFTMTDNKGYFELSNIPLGSYRLLVTHVNYHNTNSFFKLDDQHTIVEYSTVPMGDKNKTLPEIVIQAEAPPVTVKADTVEYNAGSFKTKPNSNVEDLLKKLPGVKVEKDGTLKAQGQKVNKVYVDGKEFFGDDPKMATRNLPADAVDKVQVYDKASEQSQLTGFDDGNSEKAINLKLKKDKKKGLFGKASAGGGTDDRYEGNFSVNSFKGARQLSAIGMANNTNAEGFSFMDMLNFSGELAKLKSGGGNINITLSDNGDGGMMGSGGGNSGLRTAWGGGVNYNDLIGTKLDFRSNYFYSHYNPKTESDLQREYLLPDSSYFYNQHSLSDNVTNTHRANFVADYQIDSLHSIRIAPSLSYQEKNNRSLSDYNTLSQEKILTNEGFSNNASQTTGYTFRTDFLFRKKFRKRGRTLSFALQSSINNADGDGSQQSINRFYDFTGAQLRADSINQRYSATSDLQGYNAKIVYTEPISKRSMLEFNVSKSNTKTNSDRLTYDYNNGSGKFDELNELLTNNYENTYGYSSAGTKFRSQQRKYNWSVGADFQEADLRGNVVSNGKDSIISKTFQDVLPNARFQYNFNRFSNLTLNYNAYTNQPSVTQLQPVPDISDPLNIKIGNPDLDQEYSHNIRMSYMAVDPFKNKNFFVFLSLRETQNKIVNSDVVNDLGIKLSRPVNVSGIYSLNGNVEYGIPFKLIKKSSIFISMGVGLNKNKQYINSEENKIRDLQLRPNFRFEVNPSEKINLDFSVGTNYYKTSYSLQSASDTKYFTHELGTDFSWQLPKNFYFATDFNYMINTRRADGYNQNVPLWNASVSKLFMKYQRGEIKLRVYDILNQNTSIIRTSNANYIEDNRVTVLQRYFMLSFTFSLSKAGLNSGGGGGIRIIKK